MTTFPESVRAILACAPPQTPKQKLALAAFGRGFVPFEAKKKCGTDALVLAPRNLTRAAERTLLASFPKRLAGGILLRPLNERFAFALTKDVEVIERLARIPCTYLPSHLAVNAIGEGRVPGGPYAWWEFCTRESLDAWESVLGKIERVKPVRRIRRVLHEALKDEEVREPPPRKLIPQGIHYPRPHGNILRRKPRGARMRDT